MKKLFLTAFLVFILSCFVFAADQTTDKKVKLSCKTTITTGLTKENLPINNLHEISLKNKKILYSCSF